MDVNWRCAHAESSYIAACFTAAGCSTLVNTGPVSKIAALICHLHTETWENRVQVGKYQNYNAVLKCFFISGSFNLNEMFSQREKHYRSLVFQVVNVQFITSVETWNVSLIHSVLLLGKCKWFLAFRCEHTDSWVPEAFFFFTFYFIKACWALMK